MDLLVEMELLELRETAVTLVLLVLLEHREPLAAPDPWAPPANRETEERLDLKDHVETRVRLVRRVNADRRATEVSLVCRVCLDLPVPQETRVLLDLVAPVDQRDRLALLAQVERMVLMVCLGPLDPLDPAAALEKLDLL
ncbi:hypothetical protein GJAV_G00191620 [Gymnothorax javanicus]|nr:hypothetical protein GJAV_G00191620 [Gymnothorax javanicus]